MIPGYLLPHTATRARQTTSDKWGKTTESTITVKCRIEPVYIRTWSTTGDFPEVRARLFSNPADIAEGDKIRFDGKEYSVGAVHKLYGFELDHLECDLT